MTMHGGYRYRTSRRQGGGNCSSAGAVGFGTSFADMPISKFYPLNSFQTDPNYYNLDSRNIPMSGGYRGGASTVQKGVAAELRTYLPPGNARLYSNLSEIVHSGDRNPHKVHQNHYADSNNRYDKHAEYAIRQASTIINNDVNKENNNTNNRSYSRRAFNKTRRSRSKSRSSSRTRSRSRSSKRVRRSFSRSPVLYR